jgi:hypothetical protein
MEELIAKAVQEYFGKYGFKVGTDVDEENRFELDDGSIQVNFEAQPATGMANFSIKEIAPYFIYKVKDDGEIYLKVGVNYKHFSGGGNSYTKNVIVIIETDRIYGEKEIKLTLVNSDEYNEIIKHYIKNLKTN